VAPSGRNPFNSKALVGARGGAVLGGFSAGHRDERRHPGALHRLCGQPDRAAVVAGAALLKEENECHYCCRKKHSVVPGGHGQYNNTLSKKMGNFGARPAPKPQGGLQLSEDSQQSITLNGGAQ
jgi:hypothetical protein